LGANGSSPGRSKGAAVAVASAGAWPEEQQQCGPSGIGAPLGSPAVEEGAFGTGGGTDDGSSPWWQTDAGNDTQSSMQVEPSEMSRDDISMSADFSGSVTAGKKTLDGSEYAPSPSPLGLSAASQIDDTLSLPPSARPVQELGAPPSDLFGPPPGTRGVEPEARLSQREVPPARPLRPQSPPQSFTTMEDDFAAPTAIFASPPQPPQPPGSVEVSLGDGREASWTAAVGAGPASSGVVPAWCDATQADGRAQRQSVSPGWEKQPSPPLDLGVFGAPPPGDNKAVVAGEGLFGEPAGGDFTKDSGGYDGWGMCPADQDETAEVNEAQDS
ncbi:unnamed protein product, partial [Laminaria digitata]